MFNRENQTSEENKAKQKTYYETHKEEMKAKRKVYYETHKEEIDAKRKAYNETHKEENKAKQKAYYETHKEKIDPKQKVYYETHKEEIKAKRKAYYETHKEEIKAKRKAYNETHKEEIKAKQKRRKTNPSNDISMVYDTSIVSAESPMSHGVISTVSAIQPASIPWTEEIKQMMVDSVFGAVEGGINPETNLPERNNVVAAQQMITPVISYDLNQSSTVSNEQVMTPQMLFGNISNSNQSIFLTPEQNNVVLTQQVNTSETSADELLIGTMDSTLQSNLPTQNDNVPSLEESETNSFYQNTLTSGQLLFGNRIPRVSLEQELGQAQVPSEEERDENFVDSIFNFNNLNQS